MKFVFCVAKDKQKLIKWLKENLVMYVVIVLMKPIVY